MKDHEVVNPPNPGVTIVKLWAWGGTYGPHDYLMSDSTVSTLYTEEARKYRK